MKKNKINVSKKDIEYFNSLRSNLEKDVTFKLCNALLIQQMKMYRNLFITCFIWAIVASVIALL